MLSAYLRELSQYGDVDHEYRFLDSYWVDQDRWPYIISSRERTAEFVLLNTWSPSGKGTDFAVAEFYVLPEFRGMGVGTQAFSSLLCNRSGIWELSVMSKNEAKKTFWEKPWQVLPCRRLKGSILTDKWFIASPVYSSRWSGLLRRPSF